MRLKPNMAKSARDPSVLFTAVDRDGWISRASLPMTIQSEQGQSQ